MLSHEDGVILQGERVLIPQVLRKEMKKCLHSAHLAYDSMSRRARAVIFWPGMNQEIKQMVDGCAACQEMKPDNAKESLQLHELVSTPWEKIGIDLFEIQGRTYLVTIDYFSNFIEPTYLATTTTSKVITALKKQFALFGIPKQVISDGGPQFSSTEYQNFMKSWGVNHVMSSPYHPKSNGKAESAVKVIKTMMRKTLKDKDDQYLALLELRNTPRQDTKLSPAEMMFGRHTRSLLPDMSQKQVLKQNIIMQRKGKRNASIKKHYDKTARDLPKLSHHQPVYFRSRKGEKWEEGRVEEEISDRSYIIENTSGTKYRRNRINIRPRYRKYEPEMHERLCDRVEQENTQFTPPMYDTCIDNIMPTAARVPTPTVVPAPTVAPTPTVAEAEVRPQRIRTTPSYLSDYVPK